MNENSTEVACTEVNQTSGQNRRRDSIEQRLDTMSSTLLAMKEIMEKSGLLEQGNKVALPQNEEENKGNEKEFLSESYSETTIYKNALHKVNLTDQVKDNEVSHELMEIEEDKDDPEISFKKQVNKEHRFSSSSEEQIDTSDELINEFIADCEREANNNGKTKEMRASPGVSSVHAKADDIIRQAEANREQILATPGRVISVNGLHTDQQVITAMQHSSVVDEKYVSIGRHIDPNMCEKIKRGDYVDFARLLPRDRPSFDDNGLELVNRDGQTYFIPVNEREQVTAITGFGKWEQAFRNYSNIYLQAHPHKATELLQYNHVIHTASLSFLWDNVYTYDKEFRSHLAAFPGWSWAIILQQAWSMCLKDRIVSQGFNNKFNSNGNS